MIGKLFIWHREGSIGPRFIMKHCHICDCSQSERSWRPMFLIMLIQAETLIIWSQNPQMSVSSWGTKWLKKFPSKALFLWLTFRNCSQKRWEVNWRKDGSVKHREIIAIFNTGFFKLGNKKHNQTWHLTPRLPVIVTQFLQHIERLTTWPILVASTLHPITSSPVAATLRLVWIKFDLHFILIWEQIKCISIFRPKQTCCFSPSLNCRLFQLCSHIW